MALDTLLPLQVAENRPIGTGYRLVDAAGRDIDTLRELQDIQLVVNTYGALAEAVEAIDASARPYRGDDMSPDRAYTVSRLAMARVRAALGLVPKEVS